MTNLMNHFFPLLSVALCALTLFRMFAPAKAGIDRAHKFELNPGMYRLCLIIAVVLAVAVRVYQFGSVPGGFNQDGAMAAVDAKALADYGTDRFGMRWPVHLTAWGYGQMSALLSYLMAPLIKLFGLNPVVARLPLLIVSLLGLLALYFFSRDAFGKTAALVIFAFGAINPWHILQSRWALDCNLYAHFFLFGVYFLNRAMKGKKRLWLCVSMVMFGLCMYCYGIAIYTMPAFLLMACVYLLAKKKVRFGEALLALVVWLAVAWPFILVMAINTFHWDTIETPLFTMAYFPDSVRSSSILFFSNNIPQRIVSNFMYLMKATVLQAEDLLWNNIPEYGTMYLFSMPFSLVGFVGIWKEHRKECGAALLFFFLLTGIWCGISTNEVNINRINIIYYPIMVLVGYGIYTVIRWCGIPRVEVILAAAYLIAFVLFSHVYFTTYAEKISVCFEKDFCDAVASLKDSEAEKLYITSENSGRVHKVSNETLTMFWQEIDAEYFQGKSCPEGMLPYSERYIFTRMKDIDIDPEEDAAYVLPDTELEYFPEDSFQLEKFGYYYTAVPKG